MSNRRYAHSRLVVAAEGTNQASGDKSSDNGAERASALSRTGITEASVTSHRIRISASNEAYGKPVNPKITNATLFVAGVPASNRAYVYFKRDANVWRNNLL